MKLPIREVGHGRRSPQGERGLKYLIFKEAPDCRGRSPQGERGLKYGIILSKHATISSLPARGAWIEMTSRSPMSGSGEVAPRKGSVD